MDQLISIIIPVYNTEKYLKKCLDSVVNQTLKDIEIICINDCSTDNSLEILGNYAQKDERIRIINFDENKGAAVARNRGIDKAKGEYIGFIDSDDYVDLDFYEKLYKKAQITNADAVKGSLLLFDEVKQKAYFEEWIDINASIKKNKANFYFNFTTAIFNKNFINKHDIRFPEGLVHFEDPYFTIKAAIFYNKIEIVDNAQYYYVNNENSQSRKNRNEKLVESLIIGSNNVFNLLNKNNISKEHYLIVADFVLKQILCCCNSDNEKMINIATDGLIDVFKKIRYQEDLIKYYFLNKLSAQKDFLFRQLRRKIAGSKNA